LAGLGGDSGKTLVSLGLARSLCQRGLQVRAFKKGPDYIDAAWLEAATGSPCRNLDTFLMTEAAIKASAASAAGADFLLIEGNRGLFDGSDARGTHSTAELAKLLGAPVVLVVDVTKMTRTTAALVLGCRHLDPDLRLAGVILNRVGTARQEKLIRRAVEDATGIPVIGAVPRLGGDDPLPSRHLGLVTAAEHPERDRAVAISASAVSEHVDLDRVLALGRRATPLSVPSAAPVSRRAPLSIAYFNDEAFSFYYPENLEALEAAGATLVPVSPRAEELGRVDGLYIGGGFPEAHASRLAESTAFASSLRAGVEAGLPVYAECGGLMYLASELVADGVSYPMAGVLDLVVNQTPRPQGHGYEVVRIDRDNPFFATGTELKGHEFHYSHVVAGSDLERAVGKVCRGTGLGDGRDGLVAGRVWASYLHLHGMATPGWADGFLSLAARFVEQRCEGSSAWA
jgi:cobyrinic acid a,c-diamide synthase